MPSQHAFISQPYSWEPHVLDKDKCVIVQSAQSLMAMNGWTQKETLDFLTDVLILTHPNVNRLTNAEATILGENLEWVIEETEVYDYKLQTLMIQIRNGLTLERLRETVVDMLFAETITRKSAPESPSQLTTPLPGNISFFNYFC